MAEMTAEKVKTLLESFAAVCGSNSKAKELCGDALEFIEQQAQTIDHQNLQIAKLQEDLIKAISGKEASNDISQMRKDANRNNY